MVVAGVELGLAREERAGATELRAPIAVAHGDDASRRAGVTHRGREVAQAVRGGFDEKDAAPGADGGDHVGVGCGGLLVCGDSTCCRWHRAYPSGIAPQTA